jgi:hypothetical protein
VVQIVVGGEGVQDVEPETGLRRKREVGEQKRMAKQSEGEIVEMTVAAAAVAVADDDMIGSKYGSVTVSCSLEFQNRSDQKGRGRYNEKVCAPI